MKITTKHYGNSRTTPSKIITVTIESYNGSLITEDVTSLTGEVSQQFIDDLRSLADELEEQNNSLQP
jgi:hypothetical protein